MITVTPQDETLCITHRHRQIKPHKHKQQTKNNFEHSQPANIIKILIVLILICHPRHPAFHQVSALDELSAAPRLARLACLARWESRQRCQLRLPHTQWRQGKLLLKSTNSHEITWKRNKATATLVLHTCDPSKYPSIAARMGPSSSEDAKQLSFQACRSWELQNTPSCQHFFYKRDQLGRSLLKIC